MTAFNKVNILGQWGDGSNAGHGNYQFIACGLLMESTETAVVTPVVQGPLDSTGLLSVSLLASDNFAAGVLNWNIKIVIQGMNTIEYTNVPVNFATGATQNIFAVLAAAGWTPQPLD